MKLKNRARKFTRVDGILKLTQLRFTLYYSITELAPIERRQYEKEMYKV